MSNLDLSVFDREVLVQVAEMLQFLRENETMDGDAHAYHDSCLWLAYEENDYITVIARAMLALEAMNAD